MEEGAGGRGCTKKAIDWALVSSGVVDGGKGMVFREDIAHKKLFPFSKVEEAISQISRKQGGYSLFLSLPFFGREWQLSGHILSHL